ncbi:MAG: heavy-metal-associated domain-containing protein [Firmicutes bacterium]|nr:heavy-metal-associated domain-containing protein [Bacillota bacterium]
MQEVTFKIAGTSDQQSNILLAGRLKKLPGVEQVIVDLAEAVAEIRYDPEQIGVGRLQEALADAGYQVIELY